MSLLTLNFMVSFFLQVYFCCISMPYIDYPKILSTRNFTIFEVGQLAILECDINTTGTEDSITWTTSTNKTLNESHTTVLMKGHTFYLLVYDALPGNYFCNVFSHHSPDKNAKDSKPASILMKGLP